MPTPNAGWISTVKLAYQERLIHQLDTLVREFGARLDKAERELAELKQAVPPPLPLGAANETAAALVDRDWPGLCGKPRQRHGIGRNNRPRLSP